MSIKSQIEDGDGRGTKAKVIDCGLLVSHTNSPPMLPQCCEIFTQYFTDDGTVTGSNDLGVNGSATAVDYWIPASQTRDRYISKIAFLIGYGSAAYLWEFADANVALTNGVKIWYRNTYSNFVTIDTPKSNSDFLRLGLTDGSVPTAWELRNLGATNDYGIMVSMDFTKIMYPYGIKLDAGTAQKFYITIQDDCTDADDFNCKAFGFERFEQ
jgi:hypothetical protein